MNHLSPIRIEDYEYILPEEKIAKFPLAERDASKLLVYRQGQISHSHFRQLDQYLDSEYTLFFNNTRVIPARLYFQKASGALIEVFLLHPVAPTDIVHQAMFSTGQCTWACAVGNLKRLKADTLLERSLPINGRQVVLKASISDREKQHVQFSWDDPQLPFAGLLAHFGVMPLPPYLKREAEVSDKEQYQTVYSKNEGAVAAPTAGLHFTQALLERLSSKGVAQDYFTLHVAGGTFQPIRHSNVLEHEMHSEQMIVNRQNIQHIINSQKIVPVGTTSMRTLESLYWFGVRLGTQPQADFRIAKLEAYGYEGQELPDRKQALGRVLDYMQRHQLEELIGETEIMIIPGYQFRLCDALITNFHLPGTTLIMLVAAFIGEDWRKVYQSALDQDYRFLSFGDSSLLFRG